MQCINPLRLKTPTDKRNKKNIRDGVEVGKYGQPVAYWIKKGESRKGEFPDTSKYFIRIPARVGHRQNVIHIFYATSPEQVRGIPWFASAIKFFRDLNDYLDAELVSNVVTAAFSLFIEIQDTDPEYPSLNMADITDSGFRADGTAKETRYEELIPGTIRYGNVGEKPHTISATRPGQTFEPFIRIIEDCISSSVNIPRPVLFKQHDGMNYANYRSAMLEAWRVFRSRRQWFGNGFCNPPHRMLLEEAYLKNELQFSGFYPKIWAISSADWIGPPKGQIEPIKEIQADEKAVALRVKSRREIALERSADYESIVDQIEDEENDLKERDLLPLPGEDADGSAAAEVDPDDGSDGNRKKDDE
jgi:lambda family phage portal protein